MKLGTKINLVLVTVIAVVLTVAFWIIIDIQGRNLKEQVVNDAETMTNILRSNIERILEDVQVQSDEIQSSVVLVGETPNIKYITVNDAKGTYIAATDRAIVGQRVKGAEIKFLEDLKIKRTDVKVVRDKGTFFEVGYYAPVFANEEDSRSRIIGVIEVGAIARSGNAGDLRDAENLSKNTVAKIKKNSQPAILKYNEGSNALQQIVSSVTNSNFFRDFVVFNTRLEIIASTGSNESSFLNDPTEYKQLREDTLVGRLPFGEIERTYEGVPIIMRVSPIMLLDEKAGTKKNIGLIEIHILKDSYEKRVNDLTVRMLGVGIVFTVTLVVVLAIILEREVVGPIRRYSVIARKIAEGDLMQSVEYTSNDEIGQFGNVFNSMVKNLRELDKMKSDFISVAAHQLRTPLSGVKWVLKLLLDGDLGVINEDQKGMLKRGYDTNEKMIQLVNDLLNVSRIENGKFGYKFERNNFTNLADTLIENTVLLSKERNIEVLLDNRAGTIPEFSFDTEKLLIALQNIVDNAMKYTLPGGRVTIILEKKGDYLQIKVSDTGVGIPKADIGRLFSKFFRATNVIHLQTDGSGLGLFIVKSIILRHGGQIWVDSIEGKGTTFTIVVPMVAELLPKEDVSQVPDSLTPALEETTSSATTP